jgi:hypothetical protein
MHMLVCLPATSSAAHCHPLTQVPLQYRLVEFVTALKYIYPKSFTHKSTVSPQKARTKERTCFDYCKSVSHAAAD